MSEKKSLICEKSIFFSHFTIARFPNLLLNFRWKFGKVLLPFSFCYILDEAE